MAMKTLAAAMGDKAVGKKAETNAVRAEKSWKEKFWDEANGQ